jgi:hypothetical protein
MLQTLFYDNLENVGYPNLYIRRATQDDFQTELQPLLTKHFMY